MKHGWKRIVAVWMALVMLVAVGLVPAQAATVKADASIDDVVDGIEDRMERDLAFLEEMLEVFTGTHEDPYAYVTKPGKKITKVVDKQGDVAIDSSKTLANWYYIYDFNKSGNQSIMINQGEDERILWYPSFIYYQDDCLVVEGMIRNSYDFQVKLTKVDYLLLKNAKGTVMAEGYPKDLNEPLVMNGNTSYSFKLIFKKGTFNRKLSSTNKVKYKIKFTAKKV